MFQNQFTLSWPSATLEFGGGYKGPSNKEKRAQRRQEQAFMRMMQQGQRSPEMPSVEIPEAPAPVPAPPPPSTSSADVEDAAAEARRASSRRYGLLKTTYAGDTGGYGAAPMGGRKSLLG